MYKINVFPGINQCFTNCTHNMMIILLMNESLCIERLLALVSYSFLEARLLKLCMLPSGGKI